MVAISATNIIARDFPVAACMTSIGFVVVAVPVVTCVSCRREYTCVLAMLATRRS